MIKLRAKNKNIVDFVCRRRPNLLSLEEAWNVPISAEMTSRQQQQQQQLKQKQKMPHKSNSQKHSLVSCRGLFLYLTQTRFQKRYVKKKRMKTVRNERIKWIIFHLYRCIGMISILLDTAHALACGGQHTLCISFGTELNLSTRLASGG